MGAIAVIVTLIYLAVQIRQNTLQMRSDGHVRVTDSYNDLLGQLVADDEQSECYPVKMVETLMAEFKKPGP